jgi:hypothetical protein
MYEVDLVYVLLFVQCVLLTYIFSLLSSPFLQVSEAVRGPLVSALERVVGERRHDNLSRAVDAVRSSSVRSFGLD